MERKIKAEYTIITVISAIITLYGAIVTVICNWNLHEIIQQLEPMSLKSSPNDLVDYYAVSVLSTAMGAICSILLFINGFAIAAGVTSGVLSTWARFLFSEGGTVKTNKYKALMTGSYIIIILFTVIFGPAFLLIPVIAFTGL